jgi:uncharacterized protein YjiS (DUF1127 family)
MAFMEEKYTALIVVSNLLRKVLDKPLWLASATCRRLAHWQQVRRDRAELASLCDDRLRDIGLTRADVRQASYRPFVDDPLRR